MLNDIQFSKKLLDDLLDYETAICLLINKGKYTYVMDNTNHYELDLKKVFDSYLSCGYITEEDYYEGYKNYRDGIWQLQACNLEQYLKSETVTVLSVKRLRELLYYGFTYDEIEILHKQIPPHMNDTNTFVEEDLIKTYEIRTRLPLFYIDFDKKEYFHMRDDRCPEKQCYSGWTAKEFDFSDMIPNELCYWKLNDKDLWDFIFC